MGCFIMISLNNIDIDKEYKVLSLNVDENILRRFLDIGLIPGTKIKKVLISPFKGISAYSIMDSIIAIRDKEVEGVIVEYE